VTSKISEVIGSRKPGGRGGELEGKGLTTQIGVERVGGLAEKVFTLGKCAKGGGGWGLQKGSKASLTKGNPEGEKQ